MAGSEWWKCIFRCPTQSEPVPFVSSEIRPQSWTRRIRSFVIIQPVQHGCRSPYCCCWCRKKCHSHYIQNVQQPYPFSQELLLLPPPELLTYTNAPRLHRQGHIARESERRWWWGWRWCFCCRSLNQRFCISTICLHKRTYNVHHLAGLVAWLAVAYYIYRCMRVI